MIYYNKTITSSGSIEGSWDSWAVSINSEIAPGGFSFLSAISGAGMVGLCEQSETGSLASIICGFYINASDGYFQAVEYGVPVGQTFSLSQYSGLRFSIFFGNGSIRLTVGDDVVYSASISEKFSIHEGLLCGGDVYLGTVLYLYGDSILETIADEYVDNEGCTSTLPLIESKIIEFDASFSENYLQLLTCSGIELDRPYSSSNLPALLSMGYIEDSSFAESELPSLSSSFLDFSESNLGLLKSKAADIDIEDCSSILPQLKSLSEQLIVGFSYSASVLPRLKSNGVEYDNGNLSENYLPQLSSVSADSNISISNNELPCLVSEVYSEIGSYLTIILDEIKLFSGYPAGIFDVNPVFALAGGISVSSYYVDIEVDFEIYLTGSISCGSEIEEKEVLSIHGNIYLSTYISGDIEIILSGIGLKDGSVLTAGSIVLSEEMFFEISGSIDSFWLSGNILENNVLHVNGEITATGSEAARINSDENIFVFYGSVSQESIFSSIVVNLLIEGAVVARSEYISSNITAVINELLGTIESATVHAQIVSSVIDIGGTIKAIVPYEPINELTTESW